jgi:hypothetical protein
MIVAKEGDCLIVITYRHKKWPPLILLVPNVFLKFAIKDNDTYRMIVKELPRGLIADISVDHMHIKLRRI